MPHPHFTYDAEQVAGANPGWRVSFIASDLGSFIFFFPGRLSAHVRWKFDVCICIGQFRCYDVFAFCTQVAVSPLDVCRAVSALYSVPTEGVQSVAESYLRVVWQADVSTEQFLGAQLALLLRFVGRFLVVGWFFGCGAST